MLMSNKLSRNGILKFLSLYYLGQWQNGIEDRRIRKARARLHKMSRPEDSRKIIYIVSTRSGCLTRRRRSGRLSRSSAIATITALESRR
ncbi:hypothetical protein EVAR_51751_1 [Eumeta japonica]|uniref:Uncharacterized protein n=1 Tax=Eumeta variegata TaxID=151549 RepID=A0A4C1XAZ0_EUMVA|nr:hypothetical protein EVAR_51751_1 [Eumeta japonica]